jgi:hypothetical protein
LNTTGAFRTQFTPKAFLQHLISFIVADDQVCIEWSYR